jgi:hypothetical protein
MLGNYKFLQGDIYLVFAKQTALVSDEVFSWWYGKVQRERWQVGKDHMYL